jgi:hypothetical protein
VWLVVVDVVWLVVVEECPTAAAPDRRIILAMEPNPPMILRRPFARASDLCSEEYSHTASGESHSAVGEFHHFLRNEELHLGRLMHIVHPIFHFWCPVPV